jgi:hypothetical protein
LTLPPRHPCPLDRLPASRLLLPRSGLERSDFVHWEQSGKHLLVVRISHFGPLPVILLDRLSRLGIM